MTTTSTVKKKFKKGNSNVFRFSLAPLSMLRILLFRFDLTQNGHIFESPVNNLHGISVSVVYFFVENICAQFKWISKEKNKKKQKRKNQYYIEAQNCVGISHFHTILFLHSLIVLLAAIFKFGFIAFWSKPYVWKWCKSKMFAPFEFWKKILNWKKFVGVLWMFGCNFFHWIPDNDIHEYYKDKSGE